MTVQANPILFEAERIADAGNYQAAAQLVMQNLKRNPNDYRSMALLGNIALRLGALVQSEQFLRKAIAMGATDFSVRRELASTLNQQERQVEAEAMLRELAAESRDPGLSAVRANLLEKLGRNAEARAIHESLALDHPNSPPYWIALGHNLRAANQIDDAIEAYRHAIAADHEYGEAWWGLASIKKVVLTDADIELLRDAIRIAIDVRNSAPLHFTLARALHDRGNYAEAFAHYATGNQQRADSLGYDRRELTAEIDEVSRNVDADFMASLNREGGGDATPIFIISLPRSGSTLLEQMLGSHPSIEPIGELPHIPAILRSAMELATRRGKVTVTQLIAGLPQQVADNMGQDYLRRAAVHRKTDRPYFIDKLPHNWSNTLFIKRILPQARFIDIRRPAMDCCFSNFTQSFSSAHASSFVLEDIGQCYVDYVRLMAHLDGIAPTLVHHIPYDQLIEAPEAQLRPALAYLGLDWDPRVLEFHKLDRVVRTPSNEQVRRPLNRDGVDIWKPYAQWLDPLRSVLGELAGD